MGDVVTFAKFVGNPQLPTGAQVRICREQMGWSQDYMALKMEELGFPIHQTELSKIERGENPSTPKKDGYKEVKRESRFSRFNGDVLSYMERIQVFLFRHGFIFTNEETVVQVPLKSCIPWLIDGIQENGSYPFNSGQNGESEFMASLRHVLLRWFPEIKKIETEQAEQNNKKFDQIFRMVPE